VEIPTSKPHYFVSNKPLLGKSGSSDLIVDKCSRYETQPFLEERPSQNQLKRLSSESYLTQATLDDYEPGIDSGPKTIRGFPLENGDRCGSLDQRIALLSDSERRSLIQVS